VHEFVGPGWLTTTAAAERLGVNPRTLYRLLDQGLLPAYRAGRLIRIKVSDLDDYVQSTRTERGAASPTSTSTLTEPTSDRARLPWPRPGRSSAPPTLPFFVTHRRLKGLDPELEEVDGISVGFEARRCIHATRLGVVWRLFGLWIMVLKGWRSQNSCASGATAVWLNP